MDGIHYILVLFLLVFLLYYTMKSTGGITRKEVEGGMETGDSGRPARVRFSRYRKERLFRKGAGDIICDRVGKL